MRPRYAVKRKTQTMVSRGVLPVTLRFAITMLLGAGLVGAGFGFARAAAGEISAQVPGQLSVGDSSPAQGNGEASKLSGPYRTWVEKDVRWIISPEERAEYLALPSNAERLRFIRDFWERRNPERDSSTNGFKDEHYRRISYANTRFAAGHPGWMTDRGRIYITYGRPDSIDAHAEGGIDKGAPFEVWHYRALKDGSERARSQAVRPADFRFVDRCRCGDYKLDSALAP
jgi:GWxTD domain-containing protein